MPVGPFLERLHVIAKRHALNQIKTNSASDALKSETSFVVRTERGALRFINTEVPEQDDPGETTHPQLQQETRLSMQQPS